MIIYFMILINRIISIFSDDLSDDDGDALFFNFLFIFYLTFFLKAH